MEDINRTETLSSEYQETSYRFVVYGIYLAQMFATGMHWMTFAPLQNALTRLDFTLAELNAFSLIYIGLPPVFSLIQVYFSEFFSLKRCLRLAAMLHILGGGLKSLLFESLLVAYTGQVAITFAQVLLLNNMAKIAITWFKSDLAPLLCAITTVVSSLGVLSGYSFYLIFVSTKAPNEELKQGTQAYLIGEAIFLGALSAPSLCLAENAPAVPPSPAQELERVNDWKESLKQLFSNSMVCRCFVAIFFTASIDQGFTSLLVSIAAQHDLDEDDINMFQTILQLIACFTTVGFGWISSEKGVYSRIIQWLLVVSTLGFTWLTFGMELVPTEFKSITFKVGMFLTALTTGGIFPIIFDFCNNISFPVGEQAVSAAVNIIAAISGTIVTKCVELLLEHFPENKILGNGVFLIMSALGVLISLTLKDELKRDL